MRFQLGRSLSTLWAFVACISVLAGPVAASAPQKRRWLDTEGLYYFDDGAGGRVEIALVITRDGRPIPPKANDPDAPTLAGLYVSGERFRLHSFKVTSKRVSFRTFNVGGVSYSFDGKVGREDVDVIEDVAFLVGTLVKSVRGRVVERRKARFAHAVIL